MQDAYVLADISKSYGSPCQITKHEGINRRINASVDFLIKHLNEGHSVYGKAGGDYQAFPYNTYWFSKASTRDSAATQTQGVLTLSAYKRL
jgi:hypothetical protein